MKAIIGTGSILMIQGVSQIPPVTTAVEIVKLVVQLVIGIPTAVHVIKPLAKSVIAFVKGRKERKLNQKNIK